MEANATARRLPYAEQVPDLDKARAVLKAALKARILDEVLGMYEGDHIVVRNGQTERLTTQEVLAIPTTYFLEQFGD
jgi:hypothetical protein